MASIFQVFDLNEALTGEKQQARERRYLDGGFEAPRNSLDVPDEAADVSKSSAFKTEDIPFGYEYYNSALASKRDGTSRTVSHDTPRQTETRKRAPNVVARLMGLDALPDELPIPRPRKSLHEMPTYESPKPAGGDTVLKRQHSQGAVPSSWQRPPLPRHVQRAPANVEERVLAPVLPFRDHPQEEQLQKFKKEFAAKLQAAVVAKEQDQSRTPQLEDKDRQLEEKKNKVRATLDKAKSALSQGIVPEPKSVNGHGQFEESKEFLDAMEFLQCNKDFIFQFLQQKPHVVFSNENSNSTTPVTYLKSLKKGKGGAASSKESSERKREGFSPRAFARLFMDPRKRNESKQQPATSASSTGSQSVVGSQPAIDRCNSNGSRRASTEIRDKVDDVKLRTCSSTNSRTELPPAKMQSNPDSDEVRSHKKNSARDVIVDVKERLRQREERDVTGEEVGCSKDISKGVLQGSLRDSKDIAREIVKNARESSQKNNFTLTKGFSTGKRVSIQRVDMEDVIYTSDGEELSTPSVKSVRGNVKRSCISLPSSPHLSVRSNDVAASPKATRKRASEKAKTPPSEPLVTLRTAKKTNLTLESPRRGSQARESPPLNTKVEKIMRRSASVNENAIRSEALKQSVDVPLASSMKCQDQIYEPELNLTRCRSVPNVALLRERGQCTSEGVQKTGSCSSRVSQSDKFWAGKSTAKTTSEVPKHAVGQNAEKRKGFFSVGRKKIRDVSEAMPSGQPLLFPSPAPVLARVAALAESCVSQSNTLSDADSAVNVRTHVRSSRNGGAKKGKENPRQILLSEKVSYSEVEKGCCETPLSEEGVISESSVDSDAGPCDDEFLEVISQFIPLAKSIAESQIAGETLPSTFFANKTQQQVHDDNKSPKPIRAWTTARDILDNVDEGQDSNSDKNGQPSPVSVLEAPFEAESPSPPEFKEIANSLQELRIRLRLLKAEGGERKRDELENVPEITATRKAEIQRQSLDSAREGRTLTKTLQQKTNADKPLVPNRQFTTSEILNLKSLPCPVGHEADFAFVSNILVSSGFIAHGGGNMSRWHSATQPISHDLLEKLEASQPNKQGKPYRRTLFDAINEILARKLGVPWCEPWLQSTRSNVVRTGRRLVEDVWNEIYKRQFPARCQELHNDYLESLVAQDLMTESTSWMPLHHGVDHICIQLEKAIFTDLIKEL